MNERRKLWSRGDESEQSQDEEAAAGSTPATSEQAPQASLTARVQAATGTPVEGDVDPATAEAAADLADVGTEVGTILKSAQEAAARIRQKAQEEATKIREEAETTRAEADAFARQARGNIQREANQLLEAARTRIAQADAEVEKRLREAESEAVRRRDAFKAESKQYEERLRKMLGVFRGMSSQLEELLGEQTEETAEDEEATTGATLERALQPNTTSARRI
jgi:vacuolar-type H+-ATPase subunit E/Vma4